MICQSKVSGMRSIAANPSNAIVSFLFYENSGQFSENNFIDTYQIFFNQPVQNGNFTGFEIIYPDGTVNKYPIP